MWLTGNAYRPRSVDIDTVLAMNPPPGRYAIMGQKWVDGTRQALIQPEKIKLRSPWDLENPVFFWKNSLPSLANRVYFSF
jgi:hypothetical protein